MGAVLMIVLGPVSNATHGEKVSSCFAMLVGGYFLVASWVWYFRKKHTEPKAKLGSLLGISAICGVMLGIVIWQLLH